MAAFFFFFFFFFYLYTPDVKGFPLSIRVMIGIVGIGLYFNRLILKILREKSELLLNKNYLRYWILVFVGIMWAITTIIINRSSDFITIRDIVVRFSVLFGGAYFIVTYLKYFRTETTINDIMRFYVIIITAQCLVAVLTFASPTVKLIFDNIQRESTDPITASNISQKIGLVRMGGFGMTFFGAGIDCSLALITVCALMRNSKLSTMSVMVYAICFLFITGVGLFMARTTFVGVILSIVLLILPVTNFNSKNRFLISVAILILIISFFLVPILAVSDKYGMVINFAFEGFINFFAYGSFETESSNDLKTMFIWPNEIKTYLLGDGYFNNPEIAGSYYKGIDIGYLRLLYFGGFIYVIWWFGFHYTLLKMTYLNSINSSNLLTYFIFIFILIALLNVKGIADFFPFLSLLFVYSVFQAKKTITRINDR